MTTLDILEHPDPRLREPSAPVETFDQELRELVDDMIETMRAASAIGLAAPQVDIRRRIVVCCTDPTQTPRVFINPEITGSSLPGYIEERCLSVPGQQGLVVRPTRVSVRAQDTSGERFHCKLENLEAVCLHHEVDHLDGTLFIDRLSFWQRLRMRAGRLLRR
ncbi:MAG: peptide deformylase [Halorhodospira halophila]|uniref:peptide deformylase n=1 Tax=Halorhodospira TaxID=85108 RepID=UPI00191218E7|nr:MULTISPECIES: peptide deformylase [Halorhodospira]MBK5936984.1 peptide deformylase [Halorhodospira halophila]MBK5943728.1 peptide deformylase [Halorhodospira halophila]MCC3749949.1 peptide deformylase [Halorhodospira halophila]MCG5528357.1 peptide deformylase [Halorhodospira halophila]MCG5532151.1 peptide deformylase [Halorhodospira sp. 9621]